jgi:hypothetical protein
MSALAAVSGGILTTAAIGLSGLAHAWRGGGFFFCYGYYHRGS